MKWIKRIVGIAILIEVAWLVLVNAALNLPVTQALVNDIRPEKFNVRWDSAWSWYPARVQVRGGFANGQSRSQQWQFEAATVSGSIDLIPLIFRRVRVDGVRAEDIDYRQRPRYRPDRNYSDIQPYFPDIEGREVTEAVVTPKKKRKWRVSVQDIHVTGSHRFWIFNLRGGGTADLRADLSYDTREQILELGARSLDLELGPLTVNGEREVFRRAAVRGSFGLHPFNPRAHKDITLLGFVAADLEVNVDVNSLAFIELLTPDLGGLSVNGRGAASGRLRLDRGFVLDGTDVEVDASDLRVKFLAHEIRGSGAVGLQLGQATDGQMELDFRYRDLAVFHEEAKRPLLTGRDLALVIGGDGRLLPDPDEINESRTLLLEIDGLSVPDLSLAQRYLPGKWNFNLYGGDGRLSGMASLSASDLQVDLELESERAELGFQGYRFRSNLAAALKLDNPSLMDQGTRIGGSFIRLSDARLRKESGEAQPPWSASLRIRDGQFSMFRENQKDGGKNVVDLFQLLSQSEARDVLGRSSGVMGFEAELSSLAWIGVLLGGNSRTAVSGSSTIAGDLVLQDGLPDVGTNIDIRSQSLAVDFLDYVARGDGSVAFRVEEGGAGPDWIMDIELTDADMKAHDEAAASIRDVDMSLDAVVGDIRLDPGERPFALEFLLRSATVSDMSTFNGFFPGDSPLHFVSGTASLTADILLRHDDADGWLTLKSNDVRARADTQLVRADVLVELRVVDGVPPAGIFDLSGSRITLENVRVDGEAARFDEAAWSARLDLPRGEVTLSEPPAMKLQAVFRASDSRPIVALFKNQEGWRPEFLTRMLTVEDISGNARVEMADDRMEIPGARAESDNIEVGAKAVISPETRDGVVYLRYKKADALLRIVNGKRKLDLIKVREKFDQYQLPQE